MKREIMVTFLIRVNDDRPEEEREDTDQMLDVMAFGIDIDLKKDGYPLVQPTEIVEWDEQNEFSKLGQRADAIRRGKGAKR